MYMHANEVQNGTNQERSVKSGEGVGRKLSLLKEFLIRLVGFCLMMVVGIIHLSEGYHRTVCTQKFPLSFLVAMVTSQSHL